MESKLKIIQGDSFQVNVSFENITMELINKVYFTCSKANICKELERKIDKYVLSLNAEETSNLSSFIGDYDLTVEFKDGKVNTVVYRNSIEILPKVNKLCNKI